MVTTTGDFAESALLNFSNNWDIVVKKINHWTPTYVFDRLNLASFTFRNQEAPWLTPKSIELLNQIILKTDNGLEFGAGRSTAWLAKRCFNLISIETSQRWMEMVSETNAAVIAAGKLDIRLVETEGQLFKNMETIADASIDFALVDSHKFRDIAAMQALKKVKPGGFIIIDNCERFLPLPSRSPEAIGPNGTALSAEWRKYWQMTNMLPYIHTTSGITDTLIQIKR
jgi:predicted O-methyltransferase YrrM